MTYRSPTHAERTIAIGDVHGCSVALSTLLDAIEPTPHDTIVVLGDFIDNGPDTKGVIDRLIRLQLECQLIVLCGNHEEIMLTAARDRTKYSFWMTAGGDATLHSYGDRTQGVPIPELHLELIRESLDYFETDTHFFVHATYMPNQPLEEQSTMTLRWKCLFPSPPGRHYSGKTAVVGHTAQVSGNILDLGHLLCIDTNCCRGGWLTAIDVTNDYLWQANEEGKVRSFARTTNSPHPAERT